MRRAPPDPSPPPPLSPRPGPASPPLPARRREARRFVDEPKLSSSIMAGRDWKIKDNNHPLSPPVNIPNEPHLVYKQPASGNTRNIPLMIKYCRNVFLSFFPMTCYLFLTQLDSKAGLDMLQTWRHVATWERGGAWCDSERSPLT